MSKPRDPFLKSANVGFTLHEVRVTAFYVNKSGMELGYLWSINLWLKSFNFALIFNAIIPVIGV